MQESPPPLESQSASTGPPSTSLPGRLVNIYAAPGDVFDEVKSAPASVANWLVPAVLLMAVSWVGAWLIFSQPAIQHQLTEVSDKAIQKALEKQKLSKEQKETNREAAAKLAGLGTKIMAVAGPVLAGILIPVWWGLLVWLVGTKAFKVQFPFMKAIEVAGLANMINVLGAVVKSLLILVTGNAFAAPSLALLIKDFDPQNPAHGALSVVNVMTFWFLSIVAIGLARLGNASFGKAAAWVFGIWAFYRGLFIGIGFAMQSIMPR
jgi:hypothetical protein